MLNAKGVGVMTDKQLELFERYQYIVSEKIAKYAPEYVDDEDFHQEIIVQLIEYITKKSSEFDGMGLSEICPRLQTFVACRVQILSKNLNREQCALIKLSVDLDDLEAKLDPYFIYCRKYLRKDSAKAISTFSERQRFIIAYRFGFIFGQTHTLVETASIMGVSQTRVRQLEDDVIRKLRKPRLSRVLKEYYLD